MGKKCPWCEHNPYGCGNEADCDFRNLPYEKEAILKRVKQEHEGLQTFKERMMANEFKPDEMEAQLSKAVDVGKGVQIMVGRLKEEFKMTDKEIQEYVGAEKISFSERARLMLAARKLKSRRG